MPDNIARVIHSINKEYTMGTQSAGAKGYFTLTFNNNPITSADKIISFTFHAGQISNSNGLQLTPIYYDSNNGILYVNYYCPGAIASSFTIKITIYYIN